MQVVVAVIGFFRNSNACTLGVPEGVAILSQVRHRGVVACMTFQLCSGLHGDTRFEALL
jgi:hypothetical protein